MANRLSDDELRKSLQDFDEDVGPITPTTRSIMEKRLANLRKSHVPPSKNRSLSAFSSDDSEIESDISSRVRKKRGAATRNEPTERLSLNRSRELNSSTPDSDVFKKPSPVHIPLLGQRQETGNSKSSHLRNQHAKVKTRRSLGRPPTFDVETSDSDFDAEGPYGQGKSLRSRRKSSSPASTSDLLGVSLKRHCDGTNFESSLQRKSLGSYWNATNANSKPLYHYATPVQSTSNQEISHGFRTNGYLSNTISNGDFHEEKIQGTSTNYSHCISWMLLIGVIIFFVVIGTLYMTEIQKSSQAGNKSYSKYCGELEQETCQILISLSRDLHQLLATVAGEYDCDPSNLVKRRNLTISEARSRMSQHLKMNIDAEDFKFLFYSSVKMMLKYPEWGIKLYSPSDNLTEVAKNRSISTDSSALEATQAAKTLWCRVRLSLEWTTSRLLMLCAFISLVFLSYVGVNFWKKRREAQEKLFYEMVEKVIDILQDPQDSSYQSNFNLGPYKAVVNIRDTLILPKERKEKLWLWDKVVAFIEENESRVSVDYKKINGEDFKVWQWHPNTTSDNEGGKQGKVWQGQAFNNSDKGKNANYSPTPCLKIRNMFDPEVEYGDDWQVNIQDAILEKCEGNNEIRHIAVDTSNNEGCVYMLCSSTEAAGKAFNALHGWWFDGKLVTVKYIRYARYLERFPAAENCVEPLKPSNNMRLSLSTPFFSSALERS